MVRFLHTADWQLGLKLSFLGSDDRGAIARAERFEAVRRLAQVARERQAQAVVVAGDVFDDNAVGRDTLQRARDALAHFAPLPVLLLPGNHDAGGPDCVLRRLDAGRHVHPLLAPKPFDDVPGVLFYPCPLMRRHERDDPTRDLPHSAPGDPIRVAIAHGGILDFGEGEAFNRIDWQAVLRKGFDYLALGDWHGTLSFGDRVWYSGTPEATRFKEKRPGQALLVDIDAPGSAPRVEEISIQRTHWIERTEVLDGDAHVDALARWMESLEGRSMTLMDLTLRGALSLAARGRLDAMLDAKRDELLFLRVDTEGLRDEPAPGDLEGLAAEGFVGRAVKHLRALRTAEANDALRLLHRLLAEPPPPPPTDAAGARQVS